MKVLIERSKESAVALTAHLVAQKIQENPSAVLGLATGGTMLDVYEHLIGSITSLNLDTGKLRTFNLDEYVGLRPDHPGSYHVYMRDYLFSHLRLPEENTHLPRGDASDPDHEARRYERQIAKQGGIDLQLLGIGKNGRIGFNEPSSSFGSRTRVKTLTKSTRDANLQYFSDKEPVPRQAITMGIGTILESRECLLLATGSGKSSAVAKMIEGPITAACPASALQLHEKVTVVLDAGSSKDLEHIAYYQEIHPPFDLCG